MKRNLKYFLLGAVAIFTMAFQLAPSKDLIKELNILKRADWGAKPLQFPMIPHTPKWITIHHTWTLQAPQRALEDKLLALQRFSISSDPLADGTPRSGWADIPYHFYIDTKGGIAEGRDMLFQGDSNTDYDLHGHILIVLEGNFEKEKVTPAQFTSTQRLVLALAEKYQIRAGDLIGHKDLAQTTCPGEDLYNKLSELKTLLP